MRRFAGALCLLLAAVAGVAGVTTVSKDVAVADPSGLGVSRAVGAFLPALVLLILAAWLLRRPKTGPDGS